MTNQPIRAGLLGALVLTLSGCMASDPATDQARAEQRQQSQANARAVTKAEFTPLVPLCLRAINGGAVPSDSEMAQLGFSKSLGGYTKKRGARAIDRLNLQNTTFSANAKRCTMGLGNFFGVQAAGATVREALVDRGYSAAGQSRAGFIYTKGGQTIILNGFSYNTTTSVTLSRG